MPSPNILFFNQCSLKDVAVVGGKGANLGELSSAGFPVPAGFAITSQAYLHFLQANKLEPKLRQMISRIRFEDPADLVHGTEAIRELMQSAQVPSSLEEEIARAYETLGANPHVAVRSSSAIPDLAISSFPGMMDTFYDVQGVQKVVEYVRLCWTSLWTARATANRWNKGIDHFAVRVSALVQLMVRAEFSGIAFTANPVTGEDELVVEAIVGLGEALVSGRVTPDTFVLSKGALRIQQAPQSPRVAEEVVLAAAAMSRDIEKHYGRPQDVEWAWAGGKLYILQSRNIRKPEESRPDYSGLERWNKPRQPGEADIIWTRAWSDEVLTRAITPLFYSVQADLITETYDFMYRASGLNRLLPMRLMRFHKNRGYFSTDYLKECLRYAPKFTRGDDALKFFRPEQRDEVRSMPFLGWEKLKSELYLARHYKRYTFTRCYRTYYQDWLPELLRRVRELDQRDLANATAEELRNYYWGMDRLIKDHCQPIGFGVMVHTFAAVTFLNIALQKWLGDTSSISVLLSGLPGNNTVELNEKVWQLSRKISVNPELRGLFTSLPAAEILTRLKGSATGRVFAEEFELFCQTYAFRGAEDREISFPRWGDDPALLVNVLKMFVASGDQADPATTLARKEVERETLTRDLEAQLARCRGGFWKVKVFRFLLKYAQIYSLFRENQRFEVDRVFYGQRKAFLAIARMLVDRNLLADADHIWFLSKEEVFDLLVGALSRSEAVCLITPRRAEYRKYLYHVPAMFLQGDREFEPEPETAVHMAAAGNTLPGVPASSGRATGIARVVHDLQQLSRVQAGDILVTNSTDPGWTPVFLLIRGLVLETGGILAHGTVLSREYGIPAVTSVKDATRQIHDGEVITIDGTQGFILLPEQVQTQMAQS